MYLHLPSPRGVECTVDSRFNYATFCLFLLPCVNPLVEVRPVCICGEGERGGGGFARTLECELVSDKNLQFTFSQAIQGVSPSILYVSPFPLPLEAEGDWIPIMSTTLGWLPMSLLLAVSYAKKLRIPNNRK